MTKWPASLVRLYLGQMTIQAVLAETGDGDAKTNKSAKPTFMAANGLCSAARRTKR